MSNNPLSMSGLLSGGFDSQISVVFIPEEVTFVDGIAQTTDGTALTFSATTVQPLRPKEIQALGVGLDRIRDYRKIYINTGNLSALQDMAGRFEFLGAQWRVIEVDYRARSSYCRVVVAKRDDT